MIHPRIMLPPSNTANTGTIMRQGMIVPNHWYGDFTEGGSLWPSGLILAGASKRSDTIIVSGYNTFALFAPFGDTQDPETLTFYFRMFCRSTGTWITSDPASPLGNQHYSPSLATVAAFESRSTVITHGINLGGSNGGGLSYDVVQLVIVNDGGSDQMLYTSNMFMMCGVV